MLFRNSEIQGVNKPTKNNEWPYMEESPPYMVAKKSHRENQALANGKKQNRIR